MSGVDSEHLDIFAIDRNQYRGGEANDDNKNWSITEEQKENFQIKNEDARQNKELRKQFAYWSKRTVNVYLVVVAIILICSGVKGDWFKLSDTVLSVLLGTTTLNVLGMGYIVLKGLFPKDS